MDASDFRKGYGYLVHSGDRVFYVVETSILYKNEKAGNTEKKGIMIECQREQAGDGK
ncbi:MAG: hypothetical protein IJT01_10355 [Selenomonadaceae bacterium]|nr:hypothetical protein [Selenomonadaceae bacterium]